MKKENDTRQLKPFQQDTESLLHNTITSLAEGVTGLAASEKKELALSAGHLLQALRRGHFLSQLLREWNEYREKGRIKEDYETSEQHLSCLQEMLDFLDKDLPDQMRFDTLKKIFMVAATDPDTDTASLLPHQYMRICRALSTGEIVVLSTTYKLAKRGLSDRHVGGAAGWLETIAKESGLVHSALVEFHEDELIKKRLLTQRRYADRSGVIASPYFRLSDLGHDICRFIDKYEGSSATKAPRS